MAQNALNLFKQIRNDPDLIDADPRLSAAVRQTQRPAILNEWNATKQPLKERGFLAPLGVYEDGSVHAAFPSIIADPVEAFRRQIDNAYSRPQPVSEDDAGNLYDANNNIVGNKYTDADSMVRDAFAVAGGATTGGIGATTMGMMDNALGSAGGKLKYAAPVHHVKPEISGSKELGTEIPALVNGKGPDEWGPDEFNYFGEHFGVAGLGNATKPIRIMDNDKVIHQVPESFLDPSLKPSYYDQLGLKEQGIDPNKLPKELNDVIHDQIVKAVDTGGNPSDLRAFNSYLFGMESPNNKLTNNQVAFSRSYAKSKDDIKKISEMVPWTLEEASSKKAGPGTERLRQSHEIAKELGLAAGEHGGTGTVGSVDFSRIPDFAKMYLKNPEFFKFDPNLPHTPKNWEEHIMKVASQVPGLSAKTGGFGGVFQYPSQAAIAAIDRHIAGILKDKLLSPEDFNVWSNDLLRKYNKDIKRKDQPKAKTIDEMRDQPRGQGYFVDQALSLVNNHKSAKLMLKKKDGPVPNPNVPEYLQKADWPHQPEEVMFLSPAYRNALEAIDEMAKQEGRGLFSSQWRIWDPERSRFEPHENMNPILENIGRMNLDQIKKAYAAHSEAGYLNTPGPVKKVNVGKPGKLALFSNGPTSAIVPLAMQNEKEKKSTPLRGGFGPRWEDIDEIVKRSQQ